MTEPTLHLPSSLPTGTLTFLFTDVEGSTRLWELYPEQMRAAMARHDELIETIVAQSEGVVVRPRGEGDSRFAVFTRASDAVTAAIAIQRQFSGESWAVPFPLRVRMALHTGEADLRDGDYYGTAVNRCARLRSVAHGGQILLSQITHCLVAEALPDGVGLRDLGEHSLKDLQRSEHIYQLVSDGITSDFPPLKTQDDSHNNLPIMLTSFIGRENEIAEVKQLLDEKRLLTVSGAGGLGKTRLSLQVAAEMLNSFPDGVWLVDMAPLLDATLVTQHLMNSLGIREEVCCPPTKTLLDYLSEKNALLILDNCEHLLQGIAELVETLLQGTLKLRILATSREPLGVTGETVWCIPPLSTPELRQETTVEQLAHYESVKLFIERAVAVRTDFTLTSKNASAVAKICARLDGMPLAIELAVARVRILSVNEIAARLDDRFRLLVGNQNAIPRQKTLRNLIDWSHDLLPQNERVLLRRLSVFAGGWTLPEAEDVCSGGSIEPFEMLDLLSHLVDKSLVIAKPQDGSRRYCFLETIRQYAQERLAESEELEIYARKHAEYFAKLAEESYGGQWGANQGHWFVLLEAEHDNLRSAMDWMARSEEDQEMLLRVSGSLWHFWEVRGYISEGRARLEYALGHTPNPSTYLRANGLRGAGMLARQQGDYAQATAMHQESLTLFQEIGDKLGIGRELDALGEIAQYRGDYSQALALHSESLALRYEIDDQEGIAVTLGHLGVIARDRGDYQQARDLLEESLKLCRKLGDKLLIAQTLNNLGLVEHPLCEYDRATLIFAEAVSFYWELNDRLGISNTLQNLGNVAKDRGEFKYAKTVYNECLAFKQELGDKRGIAQTIVRLAEVALYQGNYRIASDLADKSLSIFQELGIKRGITYSLQIRAFVAVSQGELDLADSLGTECLALSTEVNSPRAIAYSKEVLGLGAFARGNLGEARRLLLEAHDIFQKFGDRRSVAYTSINVARTAYRQGDLKCAMQLLEESLSVSRELEIQWVRSLALEIMGLLQRSVGHYESSKELFQESLAASLEQENQQGIANCLGALAGLAVLAQQPARAARLFAAADKIRQTIGAKMGNDDRQEYERYLALTRNQMDIKAFENAWLEGASLTSEQVINDLGDWQDTSVVAPAPVLV